jgi:imidazolonepropionase-like amidohydrolase
VKPFALLLPLLSTACLAQTFVIRGARVFDGEKTLGVRDVLVDAGKVSAVAPTVQAPSGTEIVDARGRTLLPGLFDSHEHIVGNWRNNLRKAALFGVTTVISLHDFGITPREMHNLARQEPPGELADFLTAGIAVTVKGGHGTEYGVPIPTLDNPADAQSFVDARIAEGSDVIKIIYEDFGGAIIPPATSPAPRLPKTSMKAAIDAAHARGKLAVVHAGPRAEHVRDAVEAGADGVAHSFYGPAADAGYGEMFVSHGAFIILTLVLQASVCGLPDNEALGRDPRIAPWLTAADAKRMSAAYGKTDRHTACAGSFASVPILRDAGATILAGTDTPTPGTAYGASLHEELELMVRFGLSPEQALVSATSAAARVWRLKDRGRIVPGLRADLLLVNGDPTRDIASTRDIARVWLAGVPLDRAKLLEKIKALEQK